ncbi:MAG: hypothetical protein M1826_006319 [Phylliscum demangeonii]|nr:MAG: hypothetical protein M1826_006319 [Phylliscum demangeonii]
MRGLGRVCLRLLLLLLLPGTCPRWRMAGVGAQPTTKGPSFPSPPADRGSSPLETYTFKTTRGAALRDLAKWLGQHPGQWWPPMGRDVDTCVANYMDFLIRELKMHDVRGASSIEGICEDLHQVEYMQRRAVRRHRGDVGVPTWSPTPEQELLLRERRAEVKRETRRRVRTLRGVSGVGVGKTAADGDEEAVDADMTKEDVQAPKKGSEGMGPPSVVEDPAIVGMKEAAWQIHGAYFQREKARAAFEEAETRGERRAVEQARQELHDAQAHLDHVTHQFIQAWPDAAGDEPERVPAPTRPTTTTTERRRPPPLEAPPKPAPEPAPEPEPEPSVRWKAREPRAPEALRRVLAPPSVPTEKDARRKLWPPSVQKERRPVLEPPSSASPKEKPRRVLEPPSPSPPPTDERHSARLLPKVQKKNPEPARDEARPETPKLRLRPPPLPRPHWPPPPLSWIPHVDPRLVAAGQRLTGSARSWARSWEHRIWEQERLGRVPAVGGWGAEP